MDVKYTEPPPIRLSTFIESQQNPNIDEIEEQEIEFILAYPDCGGASKIDPRPSTSAARGKPQVPGPKKYSSMPSIGINGNTSFKTQNLIVRGFKLPAIPPLRPPRSPSFSPLEGMFRTEEEHVHTRISSNRASPALKLAQRLNSSESVEYPMSSSPYNYDNKLLRKKSYENCKIDNIGKLNSNKVPGIRSTSLPTPPCHTLGFATNRTAATTFNTRSISIASISITQGFKVAAESSLSRKQFYSNTLGVLAGLSKRTSGNVRQQKQGLKRRSSTLSLGVLRVGKQITLWGTRNAKKRAPVSDNEHFEAMGEGNEKKKEDVNELLVKKSQEVQRSVTPDHLRSSSDVSFNDVFGEQANRDVAVVSNSEEHAQPSFDMKAAKLDPLSDEVPRSTSAVENSSKKIGSRRYLSEKLGLRVQGNVSTNSNILKAVAGRLWKPIGDKTKDGHPILGKKIIKWEQSATPSRALSEPSNRSSIVLFESVQKDLFDETMALNFESTFEHFERSWTPSASSSRGLQNMQSGRVNGANLLDKFEPTTSDEFSEFGAKSKKNVSIPSTKSGSPVRLLKPKHLSSIYNSFSAFAKTHSLDDSAIAAILYLVAEDPDDFS